MDAAAKPMPRMVSDHVPILCRRLKEGRKAKRLVQREVAEHLGVKQDTYKWYEIRTPIPKGLAHKAEKLLGLPENYLVFEDLGGQQTPPAAHGSDDAKDLFTTMRHAKAELPDYRGYRKDLPIWFTAEAGEGAFVMTPGNAVDTVRRPTGLANTKNAYAIYVEGSSMEPVHEAGDLLYVDPNRPPKAGRDCVVTIRPRNEREETRYMLKRLVKKTATKWVFKQYNPDKEIELPLDLVEAVHLVLKNHEINI